MNRHCKCNWSGWPWSNEGGCGCGCAAWNNCNCNNCNTCNCGSRTRRFCAFTLSGTVTSTNGGSVEGISIQYEVDGVTFTTTTDSAGRYAVAVPNCTSVTIALSPILGVTVSPEYFMLTDICCDVMDLDFSLTPLVNTYSVSGVVSGLSNNVGIPVYYTINGTPGSTATGAGGIYSFVAQSGANVSVTPSFQNGYSVAPPSYTIPSLSGNVTTDNFAYTPNPTYQISGNLSTALGGIDSVPVSYAVNGITYQTVTNFDGDYAIYVPGGADLEITPPDIGDYDVSPTDIALDDVGSSISGQDFFFTPFTLD